MADSNPNLVKELIGLFREASAIIHYFSDFVTIISFYNMVFEHGGAGTVIIWLVISFVSGIVAELLKSHLPTLLRIIFRTCRP